jgi:hypothetical protein
MNDDESKNSTALTPVGDGFDGYSDDVAGSDNSSQQQQGIIRGTHVTFGSTAEYERRDGEIIEPDVKLIVTSIVRAVLKWPLEKNARPETTVIPPGQPFPDVDLSVVRRDRRSRTRTLLRNRIEDSGSRGDAGRRGRPRHRQDRRSGPRIRR